MDKNLTFGTTLTKLLRITNIKGSDLAKNINVHASLVSKWRTDKRLIPPNSNYLMLISNFLASNVSSELQLNNLLSISRAINIADTDDLNIFIYNILKKSHENSLNNNIKIDLNRGFLSNIQDVTNDINYEFISGYENIISAGLELLSEALNKPTCADEPIIITFFNEFESLYTCDDIFKKWDDITLKLLNKGYKLVNLSILNENFKRTLKILSDVKFYYSNNNFDSFYINEYNSRPFGPIDFFIVPSIGVLACLRINSDFKFDHAFLYKDPNTINIYNKLLSNLFINSTSLTEFNKNIKTHLDKMNLIAEAESNKGKSFLIKASLSSLTLPYKIYEKHIVNKFKGSNEKIDEILLLHKRRLSIFLEHLLIYEHYSIYRKDYIENVVNDSLLSLENSELKNDTIHHIRNVIFLLENYKNFNIALISEESHKKLFNLNCYIKESHCVIVHFDENSLLISTENTPNFLSYISEQSTVNSFQNHFMDIWFSINENYRSKSNVISWFKNQLQKLL